MNRASKYRQDSHAEECSPCREIDTERREIWAGQIAKRREKRRRLVRRWEGGAEEKEEGRGKTAGMVFGRHRRALRFSSFVRERAGLHSRDLNET